MAAPANFMQQTIQNHLSTLTFNHAKLRQDVDDLSKGALSKIEIERALNMGLLKKVLRTTPDTMTIKFQKKEEVIAIFGAIKVAYGEERGELICKHADLFAEMSVQELTAYAEKVAKMEETQSDGVGVAGSADSQ
ncbi:hypothetical protein LTR37_015560 [Vermiconidia calcicola]|uniref:Uncharacterized protein n=1 Tax=Vermiconidia calcicola TaxID=1690605 RepID=A0ACC3MRY2_9PEZI|nr:hypothetical protein LTR37_015560 [Vermiconidia calcicola]